MNWQKTWELVHELTEKFQYYLLKSSNNSPEEKGECEYFDRTKYAEGILLIDTYKKDVDELVKPKYKMDWEKLRKTFKFMV